jgi:hypothetical protein
MNIRQAAMGVVAALGFAAHAQPLEHRTPSGVAWLSGGVSIDERDAMRAVAPGYNLRVVVATAGTGEYRADVPVSIEDNKGTPLLSIVTDGPWLFADVAPGRYRIRTGDGQEQTVDVRADAPTVLYFRAASE